MQRKRPCVRAQLVPKFRALCIAYTAITGELDTSILTSLVWSYSLTLIKCFFIYFILRLSNYPFFTLIKFSQKNVLTIILEPSASQVFDISNPVWIKWSSIKKKFWPSKCKSLYFSLSWRLRSLILFLSPIKEAIVKAVALDFGLFQCHDGVKSLFGLPKSCCYVICVFYLLNCLFCFSRCFWPHKMFAR